MFKEQSTYQKNEPSYQPPFFKAAGNTPIHQVQRKPDPESSTSSVDESSENAADMCEAEDQSSVDDLGSSAENEICTDEQFSENQSLDTNQQSETPPPAASANTSNIGIVTRDKSPFLKLRKSPSTNAEIIKELPFNTKLQISKTISGGWYQVSTIDGSEGFVASAYVSTKLPEPTAFLHRVEPGTTAIGIAEKYYKSEVAWGNDLRYFVNVIAYMNGIHVPATTDGWKSVQLKAGNFIWLPGIDFAKGLKGSIQSGSVSNDVFGGVVDFFKSVGQKIADFVKAIGWSLKYIPEAMLRHATQAVVDVLIGLASMIVVSVAVLAVTTAIGAAIGALFGGAGAAPGAALGFEIGLTIIEWLGLAFLLVWVVDSVKQIGGAFVDFLGATWTAAGSETKLERSAKLFAEALGSILEVLLEALAFYFAASGTKVATGKLKSTKLGQWLGETRIGEWLSKIFAKKEANPSAGASLFRIISTKVYEFGGRDIIVVETPNGPQPFYRRTGMGGENSGGAQPDSWAPFDGILGGWFSKAKYTEEGGFTPDHPLYRFGTEQNKAISEWLGTQNIPKGESVGERFKIINDYLAELGFEIE